MFNVDEVKDLQADVVNEGMWMELNHPITGKKTDARWLIASNESASFKSAERVNRARAMKAARKNKVDIDDSIDDSLDLIASLVLNWEGMMDGDNKPIPFSKQEVIKLFELPLAGSGFLEQVSSFASDTEAFFKASQKSLPMPSDTK